RKENAQGHRSSYPDADAHRRGTRHVGTLGASPDDRASVGAASASRAGVRERLRQHAGRARAAAELTKQTVGKWRSRFLTARLDGVLDGPRPSTPRRISDAQVEQMVTLTLEAKPREATHWSTRAMAARCGLSQ